MQSNFTKNPQVNQAPRVYEFISLQPEWKWLEIQVVIQKVCSLHSLLGMRSPGEKDSPRRAVDSQVSCFLLHHYISLSFVRNYSCHWDPFSP